MTLKPMNCPNCGGTVNRERLVCEYCGTKFDDGMQPLRIETYTCPTRSLVGKVEIPREMHDLAPERVIPYAKRNIAEQMVDKLLAGDMIEFRSEMDWERCQQIISARLRVLDPRYRF